jgi:hypothetical protein
VQTTRDIYLDACAQIGSALSSRGFKYAKSGPHAKRSHGDFSFGIHFQSSVYDSAGAKVALLMFANVRSKRLCSWRAAQPHPLRTGDLVAGGQIGNLRIPPHWLDINLADAMSRPAAISSAIELIEEVCLPLFAAFENVPALCSRLVADEVLGFDPSLAIEFLLCFSAKAAANAVLDRFLANRSDLLSPYHAELDRFRGQGLPPVLRTGYAFQLAFATIAYGLKPPGTSNISMDRIRTRHSTQTAYVPALGVKTPKPRRVRAEFFEVLVPS